MRVLEILGLGLFFFLSASQESLAQNPQDKWIFRQYPDMCYALVGNSTQDFLLVYERKIRQIEIRIATGVAKEHTEAAPDVELSTDRPKYSSIYETYFSYTSDSRLSQRMDDHSSEIVLRRLSEDNQLSIVIEGLTEPITFQLRDAALRIAELKHCIGRFEVQERVSAIYQNYMLVKFCEEEGLTYARKGGVVSALKEMDAALRAGGHDPDQLWEAASATDIAEDYRFQWLETFARTKSTRTVEERYEVNESCQGLQHETIANAQSIVYDMKPAEQKQKAIEEKVKEITEKDF